MEIEMSKFFKEADYKVYTTKKYDLFVFNAENREVSPKRVEAIKQSIESVGYIRNPIIVNEKFEIMDGQGRFTVLKNAGMPIEFIVEPGIGADEFRALNMRQTNWTVKDFIHSYSKTKKDYERFSKTMSEFPMFSVAVIYAITEGLFCTGGGVWCSNTIREGELKFSKQQQIETNETMNYVKNYVDISKIIGGSRSLLYCCIGWIYKKKLCDNKRLLSMIQKHFNRIPPVARKEETLKAISDVYNLNLKTGRVYLNETLDRDKFSRNKIESEEK